MSDRNRPATSSQSVRAEAKKESEAEAKSEATSEPESNINGSAGAEEILEAESEGHDEAAYQATMHCIETSEMVIKAALEATEAAMACARAAIAASNTAHICVQSARRFYEAEHRDKRRRLGYTADTLGSSWADAARG